MVLVECVCSHAVVLTYGSSYHKSCILVQYTEDSNTQDNLVHGK